MRNLARTPLAPSRRTPPVLYQTRAAALQSARETGLTTRETAPAPPKSDADDLNEEDRPKPTEGPDNLKVSDDAPTTPSESDPSLPNPSDLTKEREDEETETQELGQESDRSFGDGFEDMLSGKTAEDGGNDVFATGSF